MAGRQDAPRIDADRESDSEHQATPTTLGGGVGDVLWSERRVEAEPPHARTREAGLPVDYRIRPGRFLEYRENMANNALA
jgi:hypothetical protein